MQHVSIDKGKLLGSCQTDDYTYHTNNQTLSGVTLSPATLIYCELLYNTIFSDKYENLCFTSLILWQIALTTSTKDQF